MALIIASKAMIKIEFLRAIFAIFYFLKKMLHINHLASALQQGSLQLDFGRFYIKTEYSINSCKLSSSELLTYLSFVMTKKRNYLLISVYRDCPILNFNTRTFSRRMIAFALCANAKWEYSLRTRWGINTLIKDISINTCNYNRILITQSG